MFPSQQITEFFYICIAFLHGKAPPIYYDSYSVQLLQYTMSLPYCIVTPIYYVCPELCAVTVSYSNLLETC